MKREIEIKVVETADLAESTKADIVEVCIVAHTNDDFKLLFTHFLPEGGRHFLAYDGKTLAAHAVVTTRWLQVPGQPVMRTGYVDAVSTHPRYQGQGYGSAMMSRLGASIDDYEIAALETDKPAFYNQ